MLSMLYCCLNIFLIYCGCFILHLIIPANIVPGYACDRYGNTLIYRLNGLRVLIICLLFWFILGYLNIINLLFIVNNFWNNFIICNVLGIIISFLFYLRGINLSEDKKEYFHRCLTKDNPIVPNITKEDKELYNNQNIFIKYFLGLEYNPRNLGNTFDWKMYCYLIGALMLLLNIFSGFYLHYSLDNSISFAMFSYIFMFLWFCIDYMYFEEIHLYTYDLFAERLGFKLIWGCFVFYPFYYCIGIWSIIYHIPNEDISIIKCFLFIILYIIGWIFSRGSNLQKYYFKINKESKSCFYGLIKQETIPNSTILYSGFWGIARHCNYFGETLQAVALSLPGYFVSGSFIPFLYPLYYICLFIPRQIDDDIICKKKYGRNWDLYMKKVPYRIIPYIY